MFADRIRRLADGGIDYDHYRRRMYRMRRAARRHAGSRCLRVIRPLIAAAVVAAAIILIPPSLADCVICGARPLPLVIASHH
jgi:hypothetical protein